jgi:hypothetical protein
MKDKYFKESSNLLSRFSIQEFWVFSINILIVILSIYFLVSENIKASIIFSFGGILLFFKSYSIVESKRYFVEYLETLDTEIKVKIYKWNIVFFEGKMDLTNTVFILELTKTRYPHPQLKIIVKNKPIIIKEDSFWTDSEIWEILKTLIEKKTVIHIDSGVSDFFKDEINSLKEISFSYN